MFRKINFILLRNDDGVTPLHVAASWGNYETLKLLLMNGGDASMVDNDGKTPSDLAFEENHLDCFNLLKWWQNEFNDETPKKSRDSSSLDRCSTCSSPVLGKNSPISQIYSSPRYFTSPLKDRVNTPVSNEPKNNSPLIYSEDINHKKSWRKINFDKKSNLDLDLDLIFSDEASVITKDDDSPRRQKFAEFNGLNNNNVNNTDPTVINSSIDIGKTSKAIGCLNLSCCSSINSPQSSPPYLQQTISNLQQNSNLQLSILNNTINSKGLKEFEDLSFTTVAEESSKILSLILSKDKLQLQTDKTLKGEEISVAEKTLKEILEESIRRNQSEIENIDPKRLSICKKLTDAQLRLQLAQLGFDVGPITNNTRWLYVRRLALTSLGDDVPVGVKSRLNLFK